MMGQFRNGGSFAAQGDDGRHYLVTKWVEYVDMAAGGIGAPWWEPSGLVRLRLDDGRAVQLVDGARYQIAGSQVLLDPIAQEAPTAPVADNAAAASGVARGPTADPIERSAGMESDSENAFTSEGGRPAQAKRAVAGGRTGARVAADLMAEFGVTRAGRFFVCHGYHYANLEDAVAYAREVLAQPLAALEQAS